MTSNSQRTRNFIACEFDVSLAQVYALDACWAQVVELARIGKLNRDQFATLLEIQINGLANEDKGLQVKLFRALKYLLDTFYKETQQ